MNFQNHQMNLFGPDKTGTKEEQLTKVAAESEQCTRCVWHKFRVKSVFGSGDPNAKIMLVGEAPGYKENISGQPFVGPAGRKLEQILAAPGVKLRKNDIYITNVIKCRPGPDNADPGMNSLKACREYLTAQIDIVQPKIIMCCGNWAMVALLGSKYSGISRECMSGNTYKYLSITVIPVIHPAALLHTTDPHTLRELKIAIREAWKKAALLIK